MSGVRNTVRVHIEDCGWVDLPIGTPDNPLTHADLDEFVARVEAARAARLQELTHQRDRLAEALRDLGQDDYVIDVLEGRDV